MIKCLRTAKRKGGYTPRQFTMNRHKCIKMKWKGSEITGALPLLRMDDGGVKPGNPQGKMIP